MTYVQIVDLIFWILGGISSLLVVHFAVFAIVGFFTKKKFPETQDYKKYAVFIAARNEENVIANLVDSVRKNDYPQEKVTVFVVAHNCTDGTAEAARAAGAVVYEYNNPDERTKGYALKYLFSKIKEDYGIEAFDGYLGLDADNVLDKNYLRKMNDAYVANGCQNCITSFRNSKNFGTNIITALYGMYFMFGCTFGARGRTVTGCTSRILGTGYILTQETLKDGWQWTSLTEDLELSAVIVKSGRKIVYCDEAVFYDEQPTQAKIMFRQRLRWDKGLLNVFAAHYGGLIKSIFVPASKGGAKYKGSAYDMSANVLPIMMITLLLFLLKPVALAFAPLAGVADIGAMWVDWTFAQLWSVAGGYLGAFLTGVLLLIIERKRIKNVNWRIKVDALILWPLFLFLSAFLEIIALFKKVGWKAIPHDDTTTFEGVNDTVKVPEESAMNDSAEKPEESGADDKKEC